MNQLVPIGLTGLPGLVGAADERASLRFLEFFAANIRNPHTRRAYARAAEEFLAWCADAGLIEYWIDECDGTVSDPRGERMMRDTFNHFRSRGRRRLKLLEPSELLATLR